jgi:hypothetical protein
MPPSASASMLGSKVNTDRPLPPAQTAMLTEPIITLLSWQERPEAARRRNFVSIGSESLMRTMSMPGQEPLEPPL